MPDTVEVVHALYSEFFERGVRYFFPGATLTSEPSSSDITQTLVFHSRTDGGVDLDWMGTRYRFGFDGRALTADQLRLLGAIGAVLSARFRSIFSAVSVASTTGMFEGVVEDRFVSAFLDPHPYLSNDLPAERDVVANAIEVMRESSLLTYENRRISSGAILMGGGNDPLHRTANLPNGAMRFNNQLLGIKSFHRLCDGLRTMVLVDGEGMLVDLVDMQEFAAAHQEASLPAPSAERYQAHSRATLHGGNICLVLTPNGEIKIFAGGVQLFHFMEGRWRLTDTVEKYREFTRAVGNPPLAERLFTAGMNLAENRRGGLFVVLDSIESARDLVAPEDMLQSDSESESNKGRIHYLLRGKCVMGIELTVLQSIARVDGGIVMDRTGELLAFGAILRHSGEFMAAQDGGRTTAAVHASRFGLVLKISEDGLVSFYCDGRRVWEI